MAGPNESTGAPKSAHRNGASGSTEQRSPFNYAQSIGTSVREVQPKAPEGSSAAEAASRLSATLREEEEQIEEDLAGFFGDSYVDYKAAAEMVNTADGSSDALQYPGFASVQANFETCVQQWVRKLLITVTKYFIGTQKGPKDVVPSLLPALQNLFGNLPGWREELEDLSKSDVYTIAELQKSVDSMIQRQRISAERSKSPPRDKEHSSSSSKSQGGGKGKKKKKKGGKGGSNHNAGSSSNNNGGDGIHSGQISKRGGSGVFGQSDCYHEPDDAEIYFYSILLVHFVRQSRTAPVNEETERKIVRALLELEADALVPNAEPEEFDPVLDPLGSEDDDGTFPPAPKLKLNSFCAACVGELPHLLEELLASPYFLPEHLEEIDPTPGPGWTPLMYAAFVQSISCMKILLKSGADVDAEDSDGRTALFHSITKSRGPQAIQALLDSGSDIEHTDHVGLSPVAYAEELGLQDAVEYLQPLLEKSQQRSRMKERLEKRMRHRRVRTMPVQPIPVDAEAEARALAASAELLQELEAEEQAKQEKAKKAGKKKKARGKKGDIAAEADGMNNEEQEATDEHGQDKISCSHDELVAGVDSLDLSSTRKIALTESPSKAIDKTKPHDEPVSEFADATDNQTQLAARAREELEEVVQFVTSKLAECDAKLSDQKAEEEISPELEEAIVSVLQDASQRIQSAINTAAEEGVSVKYARKVLKKLTIRIENGGKALSAQGKVHLEGPPDTLLISHENVQPASHMQEVGSKKTAALEDSNEIEPSVSNFISSFSQAASEPAGSMYSDSTQETLNPTSSVPRFMSSLPHASQPSIQSGKSKQDLLDHQSLSMSTIATEDNQDATIQNANQFSNAVVPPLSQFNGTRQFRDRDSPAESGIGHATSILDTLRPNQPPMPSHSENPGVPHAMDRRTIVSPGNAHKHGKTKLPPGIPLNPMQLKHRSSPGASQDPIKQSHEMVDNIGRTEDKGKQMKVVSSEGSLHMEQQRSHHTFSHTQNPRHEHTSPVPGSGVGHSSPFGPTLLGVSPTQMTPPSQHGQPPPGFPPAQPSISHRIRPPPGIMHPAINVSSLGQVGIPAQHQPPGLPGQNPPLNLSSGSLSSMGFGSGPSPEGVRLVGQEPMQRHQSPVALGSMLGLGNSLNATSTSSPHSVSSPWDFGIGLQRPQHEEQKQNRPMHTMNQSQHPGDGVSQGSRGNTFSPILGSQYANMPGLQQIGAQSGNSLLQSGHMPSMNQSQGQGHTSQWMGWMDKSS